jgi:hypothetical protein
MVALAGTLRTHRDLFRLLAVLKMWDNANDRAMRQCLIIGKENRVLTRVQTADGLLTGIARLPSETHLRPVTG